MTSYDIKKGLEEINHKIYTLSKSKEFLIVSIAGGSCSGKTSVSKKIKGKAIPMDDYYLGLDKMKDNNFDSPDALDLPLLKLHLGMLKRGAIVDKPIYNFKTHSRVGHEKFTPEKVLIIEGLFALNKILLNTSDLKIFIDCPEELRLRRRIDRDEVERGRTEESVKKQWVETVEPMFKKFILPTEKYADIVIKEF